MSQTAPTSSQATFRIRRALRRVRNYLELGNVAAALAVTETLTQRLPRLGIGWFYRSLAEAAAARYAGAIFSAEQAAQLDPERAEVQAHLAFCHLMRGDAHLALQAAQRGARLPTDRAPVLDRIASILTQFGEADAAVPLHERAVALEPDDPIHHFNLGTAMRELGRREEALACFERALAVAPGFALAYWAIANLQPGSVLANHLDRIESARSRLAKDSGAMAVLDFAMARELSKAGRFREAEAALERANGTMRRRIGHDGRGEAELFATLEKHAQTMISASAEEITLCGPSDAPVPIFLVGMPRSGSTLVERLLGNHPDVRLGGELQDFSVCVKRELGIETGSFMNSEIAARLRDVDWSRVGAAYRERLRNRFGSGGYVTDKMVGNGLYVPAIAAALPEARIVHVVRDPLDTCFAIWSDYFGAAYPYAYDQRAIAAHYVRYADWMRRCESALPKRVFSLRYEQLVSVPTLVTKALYRFCGLAWSEGCEDPTRNDKRVATASAMQVRSQIHAREIGAWLPYAEHVAPMRNILIEAGLMSRN